MPEHQARHRLTPSAVPRWVWVAAAAAILLSLVALIDATTIAIAWPLGLLLATALVFFCFLWRRQRTVVPWFEVGAVYAAVVALYGTYPIIGYLMIGGAYTPTNDLRLRQLAPSSEQIASVAWLYVFHLLGFVVAYALVRGRLPVARPTLEPPRRSVVIAIAVLYVAIQGFWVFLGLFYDTSAESYIQTYLVSRRLPLIAAQLLGHLNGAKYPLSIMLLAVLCSRYPRSRPLIAGWLLLTGVMTLVRVGSRTEFVLLLLAATMMFHLLVRPVPFRWVLTLATLGLTGFVLFGIWRGGAYGADSVGSFNPFAQSSEFEVLFANASHLAQEQEKRTDFGLTFGFYVSDFTRLVPQQIAPFTKYDPADWYVTTFFPAYAGAGGGLAFGVIAESVLSGGWVSAAARGAALGIIFALIHRFYVRHAGTLWVLAFYVWVATLSYQAFRNTTFSLLVLFVYRFLPAALGVSLLASALERAGFHERLHRARALPRPGLS